MTYAVESDIGAAKRESDGVNEDSVAVAPLSLTVRDTTHRIEIAVVADGAGGHEAGDVAAYLTVNRVIQHLTSAFTREHDRRDQSRQLQSGLESPFELEKEECRSKIEASISAAHRDVLEHCVDNRVKAHTTAVVAVRVGDHLHYGWVGDSPVYIINREFDRIEKLTADHTVVHDKLRRGEIDETAALVDPQGNQLKRALGGSQYADPQTDSVSVDTGSVPLYREDVVVVASDGLVDAHAIGSRPKELFEAYLSADPESPEHRQLASEIRENSVTETDIKTTVTEAESLSVAADDLVELANDYGGKDNVSVALLAADAVPATPERLPDRSRGSVADLSTAPTIIETPDEAESENSDRPDGGEDEQ